MVVLPFVPVIPTTAISRLGCEQNSAARTASARRASGTRTQGTFTVGSTSPSEMMQTAPARAAAPANDAPSTRCPRRATNTAPGRDLCGVVHDATDVRVARRLGEPLTGHARTQRPLEEKNHLCERHGVDPGESTGGQTRLKRRLLKVPRWTGAPGAGAWATTKPSPCIVAETPRRVRRRSACRALRPLSSGITGGPGSVVATRASTGRGLAAMDAGSGSLDRRATIGDVDRIVGGTPRCRNAASAIRLNTGAATAPP